jgi:hypothetical protein
MAKLIAAILLGLPFSGSAEILYVEYTGTVASVDDENWFTRLDVRVGDPVEGLFKIDTELAPPDLFPADPTEGLYDTAGVSYNPVDFVTGDSPLIGTMVLRGDDAVSIVDNNVHFPLGHLFDGFLVIDSNFHDPASPSDVITAGITMSSGDTTLISGDGLVQSFVAESPSTPDPLGTSISGAVQRIMGEFRYYVGFYVDRLSVTPYLNVDVDITPGTIVPHSHGLVHLTLLSSATLDSLQIDPRTLRFGPLAANAQRTSVRDVNRDGIADLVAAFRIPRTGIVCGDTTATIRGTTYDDQAVAGTVEFRTAGCSDTP